MKKETISAVLMTKNEAHRIRRALDSVKWADEIVVVDDESTDGTPDICRNYGARVIVNRCEDNHDRQWNIGIDNSTSDWVLHIDADEEVTPKLKEKVQEVLEDSKGFSAFRIMRKNYFMGHFMRYGGWYHPFPILFRKDAARCVGKGIHVDVKIDGKIGQIDAETIHRPFDSISQFVTRHDKYTTKEAQVMLEEQGVLPERTVRRNLKMRPIKIFWKTYIKKQGFREGYYGLIFSVLYGWVEFLRWAKYWELVKEHYEKK